jgi:colanic acid/amylovoran biosynthesis protein
MFKVCLLGASLDTGNMGVSALAASLVGIMRRIRPDSCFSFFIGHRSCDPQEIEISGQKVQIMIINYRLSPKASPSEHLFYIFFMAILQHIVPLKWLKEIIVSRVPSLRALQKADWIGDIRGGDSFSDVYGLKRMILGSLPSMTVLLLGRPLVLLPQTYGPYQSEIARIIARWILSRARWILSRDKEGIEVVKEILGRNRNKKRIDFCPDVAFSMESMTSFKPAIHPPLIRKAPEDVLIGFNINGLLFNGGYTRNNMFQLKFDYKQFVKVLSESILRETSAHLLLIPHTFAPNGHIESDSEGCHIIFNSLKDLYSERLHILEGEYDQFEIKAIIGQCDFFVGSRMHSCIAALSQGVPTVGVAYSRKFRGIFESVDLGDMILDARSLDLEITVKIILKLFQNRADSRRMVLNKINIAKGRLNGTFKRLLASTDPVSSKYSQGEKGTSC